MIRRTLRWFVDRAGLEPIWQQVALHPVPPGTADRRTGWMYVLGIATLSAFLLQLVTGIALATKFIPSPEFAPASIRYVTEEVPAGGWLRGMHFFGASAMLVLVALHVVRVYLTGSYKFPREVQWLSGILLLGLTGAMAITGPMLRWDPAGRSLMETAAGAVGALPLLGPPMERLLFGGGDAIALLRFHTLHVIVFPLLILAVVGVHLYLVLLHGVSEPPARGRRVDRTRYRAWYREHLERSGRPYFPDAAWKEAVFASVVVTGVVLLGAVVGPPAPEASSVGGSARPDWFLLWHHGLLHVAPEGTSTWLAFYLPLVVLAGMAVLPLVSSEGERHPLRRPWAIAIVLTAVAGMAVLTLIGLRATGSA